jgi:rod shape determining protein RodA
MARIKGYHIRDFDWVSFALTIILSCIGLLAVYSATYRPDQPCSPFFYKQLFGLASGLVIYAIFASSDYRTLLRWGYWAYFLIIAMLIFTLAKGHIGMGGQRWINLGLIKLQPSKLTKLCFPAIFGYYLYTHPEPKLIFRDFIPIFVLLALSFLLIVKQPDLGTALILVFSTFSMLWIAGIDKQFFICGFLACAIAAPVLWHCLKSYQQQRILVFFGYGSAQKERYQIEQSKIAIGSGGMTGKGFLRGTQNQLLFLPESRTDMIFAVIAEETGFCGVLIIILLYILLFSRLFAMIGTIKHMAIQVLAVGLLMHIVFSAIINICMVIDLLPIVGIPLPLISYGVSNLWITLASLGWLNGIAMRRFYIDMHI